MEYKVSDSVWHRVVQIIQEAMITGVDCADLMRQIRLTTSEDTTTLVLTQAYEKQVHEMHAKYLSEAENLKTSTTTILTDAN